MIKIVVGIVIAVILLALYIFLRPRNDVLHANMRPGTGRLLRILVLMGLAAVIFFIARSFLEKGDAWTLIDKIEEVAMDADSAGEEQKETDNTVLVISVCGGVITIGDASYSSVHEADSVLNDAVKNGKTYRLIDDYARKSTYLEVRNALVEMGIEDKDIEEKKNL